MTSRKRRLVGLAVMAATLALWMLVFRPQALGGPALYVVVRGSSMLPTYANGDLVVLQSATSYAAGDIVAYRVPHGEIGDGHVVIHRITGGDGATGFVVKGDHNNTIDPWTPRLSDVAGKSWWVIPGLGRVIAFIHQPVIAAALASALMVTFILARSPSGPRTGPPQRGGSWRRLREATKARAKQRMERLDNRHTERLPAAVRRAAADDRTLAKQAQGRARGSRQSE